MAKRTVRDRRFKREKKPRISRTEEYVINVKYLGEEPKYIGEVLTDAQLSKAYNWYNYMCTPADARQYIVEYMEDIGKKNVARLVRGIPDSRVPMTAGWLCRVMSRGGKITDRSKEFLLDRVDRAIERSRSQEVDETQGKVKRQAVDVKAATRDRARDIIGNIEAIIDRGEELSLYEYMQKGNIPPIYAVYIAEYYSKMVTELQEVLEGNDPDLREGYRNYLKPQVRKLLEFYTQVVSDANMYGDNAKKARKINRRPRVVSIEKVIKNLKFKKTDQDYKLISIEPSQIMAAQELWTFNTKNRILTVYRAQDAGGLGVKNVRITGYSESSSLCKKLRKPEDVLQRVLTGGKPMLRGLMDEIKTKPSGFSDRVSADTILMRVVK